MNSNTNYPDELTFEELIYSMASIVKWFRKHLVPIIVACLICSALSVLWAVRKPETYTATLSFMLNDDNNPQVSNIGNILGQFGIPITSGKYNVDKLLEISKSRRILESTLFQKKIVDDKEDLLANHFINIYDLASNWSSQDGRLDNFKFSEKDPEEFGDYENFALKRLNALIMGSANNRSEALFTTDYGKTDYIMTFSTRCLSEELAIEFTNEIYDQISQFYVQNATEKNQSIYNLIKQRRDSLADAVQNTTYDIASLKDKSQGTFRRTNNVDIANLEGQLIGLETAFQEVEKSLNAADIALKNSTPLIKDLDRPIAPIAPNRPSTLKYGLLGITLGFILYVLFLNAYRIIQLSRTSL